MRNEEWWILFHGISLLLRFLSRLMILTWLTNKKPQIPYTTCVDSASHQYFPLLLKPLFSFPSYWYFHGLPCWNLPFTEIINWCLRLKRTSKVVFTKVVETTSREIQNICGKVISWDWGLDVSLYFPNTLKLFYRFNFCLT